MSVRRSTAILLACAAALPGSLEAADISWNRTSCSTGFFETASCWNGGVLPGPNDNALLTETGSYGVQWRFSTLGTWNAAQGTSLGGVRNNSLTVANGIALLDSTDFQYTYELQQSVTIEGNGTLSIGTVLGPVNIAVEDNFGTINVGTALGNGTLDITNNAVVRAVGSSLAATRLGIDGGTGTVTVTGTQSRLESGRIIVGESGTGVLHIQNDALASASGGSFGDVVVGLATG